MKLESLLHVLAECRLKVFTSLRIVDNVPFSVNPQPMIVAGVLPKVSAEVGRHIGPTFLFENGNGSSSLIIAKSPEKLLLSQPG